MWQRRPYTPVGIVAAALLCLVAGVSERQSPGQHGGMGMLARAASPAREAGDEKALEAAPQASLTAPQDNLGVAASLTSAVAHGSPRYPHLATPGARKSSASDTRTASRLTGSLHAGFAAKIRAALTALPRPPNAIA